MSDKKNIRIFDTTLRDGEQSPGCSMNLPEKLEVAQALVDLGVDIIEAGFPIASPGDFEAVSEVAKITRDTTVCGLARCNDADIDPVFFEERALLDMRFEKGMERPAGDRRGSPRDGALDERGGTCAMLAALVSPRAAAG